MTAEGQPERIVRPEEVAWAITQLAAPAASFVTGVVLPDDGGAVVPHTVTANPPSLRNSDSRLREVASFTPRTEPGRPRHGRQVGEHHDGWSGTPRSPDPSEALALFDEVQPS
ncbi:hypothetical protein SAURM35S_00093 [Streptomyces aurantiogriseus]